MQKELRQVKKILILRFSSIGDIVLTTPVIRNLKKAFPDCQIHYATKPSFLTILENNPYVDKVHVLDGSLRKMIKEFKSQNFDLIIDLHRNLRTTRIKRALSGKAYTFDKLNIKKWLLVNLKINRLPNVHIVDRYMATLEDLGVNNDDEGLDYFIPEKDFIEDGWLPDTHEEGFAALSIGGNHATKKLPLERLIYLCEVINRPIVLLGGKEDEEIANQLEAYFRIDSPKSLNCATVIFNGCGKFNLNQSADLIRKSHWVFTHDTGLMHIAAAFKKEIYSIWGNTVPAFGMYPYQTKFHLLENKHLNCRPCSKIGYNKCPKGHFRCMTEQVFDIYLEE